jgi:competence protein ComEC
MPASAIAFVFGAWLLQQQAALPSSFALGALALAGIALAATAWLAPRPGSQKIDWRMTAAPVASFVLGFAWAGLAADWRLADSLAPRWERQDIRVTGVIASLPQAFERGLRFDFDVEGATPPVSPRSIALSWYGGYGADVQPPPEMHAGERWTLTVRLRRPHGNANPHGFDYEALLLERGIRATGAIRPGPAQRLDAMVWMPGYAIERLREHLRERFWDLLPDHRYAGVMIALALGEQNAIGREDWQLFARTGVSHLMSISGLHITMIAGLVAALVLGLWRRIPGLTLRLPARKAAAAAGMLAALAYCLVAGMGVPAQRTLVMLSVVALALWFDRLSRGARVLGIALVAVTLLDPWAVLSAGFWLSFGAVALIFYVGQGRLRPSHWLAEWGRVQWAVTVGLTPLLLALFGQVSLVSPLANAIAIPVVSFVITPLALLGILFPVALPLEFGHWIVEWLMAFLHALDMLPLAVWRQHAPPAWSVPFAVLGIAWILLPRGFPARWIGAFLLLPLFLVEPPRPADGEARITVLDVGQGLAVLVETRDHAMLYDAGPQYGPEADAGGRVIVPYLLASGIGRLDGMIVTHNDLDHSGGALSVLDAVPVEVVLSSLAAENPIRDRARLHQRCLAGQRWHWDGVELEMLHPAAADYAGGGRINDLSCVLRVATARDSVLLTGDIEKGGEAALLARDAYRLRSAVLIAPHHGSRTSSTPAFIAAVRPTTTVFTTGYLNRFGHPRDVVVARYVAAGSRVMRTDETGAVTFVLAVDGIRMEAWRTAHARYWHFR